jgi:hypothetical protein
MLKKTLIWTVCVTTLFAGPALAQKTYFKSGFLVGVHGGFVHASRSFKNIFDPAMAPLAFPASASGKARKDGGVFGVLGGYRHIFQNKMTIGGDVSGDLYFENVLEAPVAIIPLPGVVVRTDNRLSRQYSLIPSINFGRIFCGRWHVALGLGLGVSRFSSMLTAHDDLDGPVTMRWKKTRVSFVPSVRAEYAATQKVSVIGNISYEICKKMTKNFDGRALNGLAPDSQLGSSIAPRYVTLKIGAVYRL